MKFTVVLTALLLCCDRSVFAQPTIEVDFAQRKVTKTVSSAKKGEEILFRIVNINRVVYKADVQGQTLTYNGAPSSDLTALLGISGVASVAAGAGDARLIKLQGTLTKIERLTLIEPSVRNIASQYPTTTDDTKDKIYRQVLNYLGTTKIFGGAVTPIAPVAGDNTAALKLKLTSARDVIVEALKPGSSDANSKNPFEAVSSLGEDLETQPPAAGGPDPKPMLDAARDVNKNRETLTTSILAGLRILDALINDSLFTYTTTLVADKDAVQFTYSVTPNTGYELTNQPLSGKVQVLVSGVWRTNFSGGLFWLPVADDAYTTGDRTKVTTTSAPAGSAAGTITSQSGGLKVTDVVDANGNLTHTEAGTYVLRLPRDSYQVFPGGLLHIYKSSGRETNFALSLGGGKGNGNPVYAAGVSALFGSDQRTALTLGFAGTKVKRLSTDLKDGGLVPEIRKDITGTVSRYGLFVALTVNIGTVASK